MDQQALIKLVQDHSPLLSAGKLAEAVAGIPEELHDEPRCKFLQAVLYYSEQHKAKPPDWQGAAERFLALQDEVAGPSMAFYVPNYLLLSRRNAGGDMEELEGYFRRAQAAADDLDGPEQNQLLGFLLYNWSRCLIKVGRVDEALKFYNAAGSSRVAFYEFLKREPSTTPDELKGAATQVWKIREDWGTFFPSTDISQCSVSEEVYAEVAPLANPDFSAKPLKGPAIIVGLILSLFLHDLQPPSQSHWYAYDQNENSGAFYRQAA